MSDPNPISGHKNSLSASLPDFNQDIMKEMTKEKDKLNRFLEIKEGSIARANADLEHKRKMQLEKEKKIKKKQDVDKKEYKNRMKKYQELNDARNNKLAAKDREMKEMLNDSRTHYRDHIKEINLKKEQQDNQEKARAQEDFKRQQKKLAVIS
jgi:hypothetical protein